MPSRIPTTCRSPTWRVIYGFNNGCSTGYCEGVMLAEDGHYLGNAGCSHEGYMTHDLGILEGSKPYRHETFRKHYPDGYRMDFVPMSDVRTHPGLSEAYRKNQALLTAETEGVSNA